MLQQFIDEVDIGVHQLIVMDLGLGDDWLSQPTSSLDPYHQNWTFLSLRIESLSQSLLGNAAFKVGKG